MPSTNADAAPLWPAPLADRPVNAVVRVPGSKSATNRALVLAALADGPSTISRPLIARDTLLMAAGLRALGVEITDAADGWRVTPRQLRGPARVDCGLAGTVMRFLPAVAALSDGEIEFDGDPAARVRPMSQTIEALRQLGVKVEDGGRGTLPFVIHGTGRVAADAVEIDAAASSQFVSALLLVAARFDNGLTLRHVGGPLPSLPHIEMTIAMLAEHSVQVQATVADRTRAQWRVEPGRIAAVDCVIEPDLSNAFPFLAAAMATGGRVVIPDWPAKSTQPGGQLPQILRRLGARTSIGPAGLELQGPARLQGIEIDLSAVGELTPVLAALCALAETPSRLTGIAHLRGHETDRLKALATELNRCGARVTELSDGLAIEPAELHGAMWQTYHDHRMATAAAVLGLRVPGIEVVDIETTAKTLPGFAAMWAQMLQQA